MRKVQYFRTTFVQPSFSKSRTLALAIAIFLISPGLYLLSGSNDSVLRKSYVISRGKRISSTSPSSGSFTSKFIRPTQQLCVEHADESEYCIYDGPLCYDGTDLIVIVDDDNLSSRVSSAAGSSVDFNKNEMTKGDGFFNERGDQCIDWRLVETKDVCYYHERANRRAPPAASFCSGYNAVTGGGGFKTGKAGKEYASSCAEATITTPVRSRLWGPDGRMLRIREFPLSRFQQKDPTSFEGGNNTNGFLHVHNVHLENIFPGLYSDVKGSIPPAFEKVDPIINPANSDNSSRAYWLDGALYVSGSDERWLEHLWHGASAMFPLFAAKRQNNTVVHIPRAASGLEKWPRDKINQHSTRENPKDERHVKIHSAPLRADSGEEDEDEFLPNDTSISGFLPPSHGYRLTRGGPGMHLPPMDYVLVTDKSADRLEKWLSGLWPLLSQPHTSLLFPKRIDEDIGGLSSSRGTTTTSTLSTQTTVPTTLGDKNTWMCVSKGVLTGIQPRLFTGIADASAFRLHSWALAGIDVKDQYTHYPPRKIVVLAREFTRELKPQTPMFSLLKATGLPVQWEQKLGKLSFEEQVKLMANAGIVIGAHGAALTNIMFAPSHAAVIELTPHLFNWPLYRKLADAANLFYYRVPAEVVSKERLHRNSLFLEGDFTELCEDPQRVSSIDANTLMACNGRSKNSNINIDFEAFLFTLISALDDIGCRPRQFSREESELFFKAQEDADDPALNSADKIVSIENAMTLAKKLGISLEFLENETKMSNNPPSFFFVQPIQGGRIFNIAAKCSGDQSYFEDKMPFS